MTPRSRRLAAASVVALLLGSGVALAQAAPDGRAWVDAPLGWVLITAAPVEVVGHAADPDLVIEMRLDVDGVTVASAVPEGFGQSLATASFEWTPETSGVHVLEVFGRDTSGEWGAPGRVQVRVDLEQTTTSTAATSTTRPAATSTTRPATTTTRAATTTTRAATTTTRAATTTTTVATTTTTAPATTTTTRPTTTTTACDVGVPSPASASGTDTLTPTLHWGYSGCRDPEQFEIQVSRDSGFARIEQVGGGGPSDRSWTTGSLSDCTSYYWRIRTYDLGVFGPWSSSGSFFVQASRSCG